MKKDICYKLISFHFPIFKKKIGNLFSLYLTMRPNERFTCATHNKCDLLVIWKKYFGFPWKATSFTRIFEYNANTFRHFHTELWWSIVLSRMNRKMWHYFHYLPFYMILFNQMTCRGLDKNYHLLWKQKFILSFELLAKENNK